MNPWVSHLLNGKLEKKQQRTVFHRCFQGNMKCSIFSTMQILMNLQTTDYVQQNIVWSCSFIQITYRIYIKTGCAMTEDDKIFLPARFTIHILHISIKRRYIVHQVKLHRNIYVYYTPKTEPANLTYQGIKVVGSLDSIYLQKRTFYKRSMWFIRRVRRRS